MDILKTCPNWKILKESPNPNFEICEIYPYPIRSLRTGKIISEFKDTKGYFRCNIDKKILRKHRIIANNLIPNPDNFDYVGHRNGIRDDNHLENLYWW